MIAVDRVIVGAHGRTVYGQRGEQRPQRPALRGPDNAPSRAGDDLYGG